MKYITNPFEFFIMSDYNFSLVGTIVGFFLVFLINLRIEKKKIKKFIDPLALSFLFILFIGYIGAHLGGQVYGRETTIGIEILYSNAFSPVPFQVPIFPLSIVYSIIFFILFSSLYILSMFVKVKGLIGYLGLIIFGCIILIFEFFSGKYDLFKDVLGINLVQLFMFIFIPFIAFHMNKLLKDTKTIKKVI